MQKRNARRQAQCGSFNVVEDAEPSQGFPRWAKVAGAVVGGGAVGFTLI